MKNNEIIERIEIVENVRLQNVGNHTDKAKLGAASMFNLLFCGYELYDGYEIKTTEHKYHILISNGQNCCEHWGYIVSEDNLDDFIGKELISVEVTNTALDKKKVKELWVDSDQIQFVDFTFSDGGVLQFAVYNAHDGYYGHPIIIAKDDEIMLQTTL